MTMFGLGAFEIVIVAVIAVMVYGKRLPEVGKTFGKTMGGLRRQWQELSREFEMAANVDAQPVPRRTSTNTKRLDEEGGPMVASPKLAPPPGEAG